MVGTPWRCGCVTGSHLSARPMVSSFSRAYRSGSGSALSILALGTPSRSEIPPRRRGPSWLIEELKVSFEASLAICQALAAHEAQGSPLQLAESHGTGVKLELDEKNTCADTVALRFAEVSH